MAKQIRETVKHRKHLDYSVELIGTFLYGPEKANSVLKSVRQADVAVVDDWGCLKSTVRMFETECGSLTQYGMKHMRAFANICNSGVPQAAVSDACRAACGGYHAGEMHPSKRGYSA